MNRMSSRTLLLIVLLWGAYVFVAEQSRSLPRKTVGSEIRVALPLFVQVFMFGGDRYLAANVAGIRALVVETGKMSPDEFAILGRVQLDVSWLNPGHEDNYYTAAAILPWNGQLEAAQGILARASEARFYDYQPAFYYAFHLLHYQRDAVGASDWLLKAAEKLPDGDERLQIQNLAAIWLDKANDLDLAIRVVEGMAQQARRNDFRVYLEQRVKRLSVLKALREAETEYVRRHGKPLAVLDDLVTAGVIRELPLDPFGFGYDIDSQRRIVLRMSPPTGGKAVK